MRLSKLFEEDVDLEAGTIVKQVHLEVGELLSVSHTTSKTTKQKNKPLHYSSLDIGYKLPHWILFSSSASGCHQLTVISSSDPPPGKASLRWRSRSIVH